MIHMKLKVRLSFLFDDIIQFFRNYDFEIILGLLFVGIISSGLIMNHMQTVQNNELIKITSIKFIPESSETFKIIKIEDDTTTEDVVLPTGVPDTKTDVATKVTYQDNTSESISQSMSKLQPLINQTFTRRTSNISHYQITGVNQKTHRQVTVDTINNTSINKIVNWKTFQSYQSDFDATTSTGIPTRDDIISSHL